MVQRGGETRLGLELAKEGGVAGQCRMQELDGDAPAKPRVVGGEDLGRGAGADHSEKSVAAANNPADLFEDARHGIPKG